MICAEASLGKKDVNTAKRLARKAVDADPTLHQGYKLLLSILLSQKKYNETGQLLNAFKKQLPCDGSQRGGRRGVCRVRQVAGGQIMDQAA